MRYIVYELTGSLPLSDIYLGDDSCIVLPELVDLTLFADYANDQFGMNFNATKSFITYDAQNIHFLGYYNQSGTPSKPLDTIVVSTIYPERTVRDKVETISRLIGQAYSCFEPTDAHKFFLAAKILAEEDDLERSDIEEHIHNHPYRFKYLQTLGVDPLTIVFPDVDPCQPLVLITQPGPTRRLWSHRNRDLDKLYTMGILYLGEDYVDYDDPG